MVALLSFQATWLGMCCILWELYMHVVYMGKDGYFRRLFDCWEEKTAGHLFFFCLAHGVGCLLFICQVAR
jgi:hypothetical protein